jgi:hypothetical protein
VLCTIRLFFNVLYRRLGITYVLTPITIICGACRGLPALARGIAILITALIIRWVVANTPVK